MDFHPSIHNILDLSASAKNALVDLSRSVSNQKRFGYGCSKQDEHNLFKLSVLKDVLNRHKQQRQLGVDTYLTDDSFEFLKEQIRKITGKHCKYVYTDLQVDDSERDSWIVSNPTCVSYEEWEKWVYYFCDEIDIEFTTIRQACNFMFEVTREVIPCDVMLAISVYKEACNLDLQVVRTDEECKIDFDLLHEKVDCNLDFTTYLELTKCNLSFDVIKTVYECGLELQVSRSPGTQECNPTLVSDLGEYSLKDIKGNINLAPLKKLGLKTKLNKKDLLQDYGA